MAECKFEEPIVESRHCLRGDNESKYEEGFLEGEQHQESKFDNGDEEQKTETCTDIVEVSLMMLFKAMV